MRQIPATGRPSLLLPALVVLASALASTDVAAQDVPGPPVGAVLPASAFGSTVAAAVRLDAHADREAPRPKRPAITGSEWLICDPAAEDCASQRPGGITMQTMPRWSLRIRLPRSFELRGHVWTMTHEEVDRSLRQGVVGGTLRHQTAGRWAEVGVGLAERTIEDRGVLADDEGAGALAGPARATLERLGPALLAGIGVSLAAGRHMRFDLRLRGGLGVGADAESVYHAHLGVAFVWR